MDPITGIVQLLPDRADGRLRQLKQTLVTKPNDPVVPAALIESNDLRPGVEIAVQVVGGGGGGGRDDYRRDGGNNRRRRNNNNKKGGKTRQEIRNAPRVQRILQIEGVAPGEYEDVPLLEDRTTIDPEPQLVLEYPGCPPACRLIDLFCPIGYGQRGLIVSPPKAGKTILLHQIANAISKNHEDCIVWALLIDERPEEVTDFRRNVPCDVLASSNDHPPERHVELAILAIERAKRLAEQGKHVVILLDSLTRLGRAFNTAPGMSNSGRTLTGGLDSQALSVPKQLYGAARNTEEAGSLTIIATCLIDTGSRGDQIIFEEFKGTGNMELILDRDMANRRIWPAMNLADSGTRKEHLLLGEAALAGATGLRRRLMNMTPINQIEQLLRVLAHFKTNDELLSRTADPVR